MQSYENESKTKTKEDKNICLIQTEIFQPNNSNNYPDYNCNEFTKSIKAKSNLRNLYEEFDHKNCLLKTHLNNVFDSSSKLLLQEAEKKKTGIDKKLEENRKKLKNLIFYGNELVYNIKIANEKRDSMRHFHEFSRRQGLQENLLSESAHCKSCFPDITTKWFELKLLKEPIELFEKMKEHNFYVSDLLKNKDNIIKQCQIGINYINCIYYSDKEKQSYDLSCLVERIDNQIELLKDAYNHYFGLLYDTIQKERSNIEVSASMKWREFYEEMLKNEKTKFLIVKEKEAFYNHEISRVCAEQEAITRRSRIRLEKESEMLQWELLKTRNVVLMTSEKLDYNYQVLQKRNEENVIINNQQKRRVGRLNECISSLKKKILETNLSTGILISKLTYDIEKLHTSISDLEKKSHQFRKINEKKYKKIYEMNIRDMQSKISKVFKIDKVLYQQHLIFPWNEVKLDVDVYNVLLTRKSLSIKSNNKKSILAENDGVLFSNILHKIFRNISDRAAFLIEDGLIHILEPFIEEENSLVRVDNIMTALRINDISNIAYLKQVFAPYCWCPNCSENVASEALSEVYINGNDISLSSTSLLRETKKKQQNLVNKKEYCGNHFLVIEPSLVLTALKRYTKKHTIYSQILKGNVIRMDKNSAETTSRTARIVKLWSNINSLVSEDAEALWISLEHGFTHYLNELNNRQQLHNNCIHLQNQNEDFMRMLSRFTDLYMNIS